MTLSIPHVKGAPALAFAARAVGRAAVCSVLSIAWACGSGDAGSESETGAAVRPHGVIVIVPDSLRADHLGVYGYPRPTSPHLDALAQRGVLFENAFSQSPWTTPSIASLFTSVYPSVHRLGHIESDHGYTAVLSPQLPTLAEILQQSGYRTAALVNNPSISERRGFSRGFDVFVNDEKPRAPTVPTNASAIAMLEEISAGNFFLLWHILDPHWPNWPPPEFRDFVDPDYDGRFRDGLPRDQVKSLTSGELAVTEEERRHITDLYDGEVRFVDHQIGALFDALDRLDLWDRVTLVVTSDHGESLLERGHYGHSLPMYEETLRVPLVVYDARLEAGRVPQVVESIDILPTVRDLAGLPVPPSVQGRSLRPLLDGQSGVWRPGPAWSESPQFYERKSLRTTRLRLIWGATGRVLRDGYEPGTDAWNFTAAIDRKLYDVSGGPKAPDLAAVNPEQTAALMKRVHHIVRSNERRQVDERSMLRTVFFDGAWQDRAVAVDGPVGREGDAIVLDRQPGESVRWRIDFPKELRRARLVARAHCDQPVSYLVASFDRKRWKSIDWPVANHSSFEDGEISLEGPSGSTVWVAFLGSSNARCALATFRVHGFFDAAEPVVDELTRENLRALGYVVERVESTGDAPVSRPEP